jgi:hypothetical protein
VRRTSEAFGMRHGMHVCRRRDVVVVGGVKTINENKVELVIDAMVVEEGG